MNIARKMFKSKPVGFTIIAACVLIVLVFMASLLFATFSIFKTGINGAVNTQTRELSTQIVYNYENYINSIIETSNIIQTDIDRYYVYSPEDSKLFGEYLENIIRLKSDIIKISIYDCSTSECIASSNENEIGQLLGYDDSWYTQAVDDPTIHVFSTPYSMGKETKVNVSKHIKFQNGSAIGVLKIEISFRSFIDLLNKSNLGKGGHITIIDPDYKIVYTSLAEPELALEEIGIVKDIVLGAQNAVLGDYSMTVNVDTLSNTKWRICIFINTDKVTEIERVFLGTTIFVSCIVLVTGVLLFMAVARAITSPMKKLELAMHKVEKSDYFRMEELDITASKELEALIKRFNKMMYKINELMQRVIMEQNEKRKSDLRALQNQINPHFLYNTLDSIIWLIENEKNVEAVEMVVALARLFRIGISNDSEVISVRDEVEHVRNYLLIQNIRYADAFDYEFDVDETTLDIPTMKLILQPIVENCIYHGLKNKIDKGHIKISIHIEGNYLKLSVADNGYGIRQEAIDALYKSFENGGVSKNVGLKNIYKRVKIYCGGDAEMIIESELDKGTTISIKEPLNRK